MLIRQATNNDENQWDSYVERHPLASPYHRFAWKISIENSYRHTGYYFIAEEEGKITGVLPTIAIKAPLGHGKLCALPFCDIGGCLAESDEIHSQLIEHARQFANQSKFQSLEHRTFENKSVNEEESLGQKVRMLLDLPGSSEELLKGFKSKLRSQINKAKKNGLTTRLGREPELIDAFYRVFTENMRKLGSPVHGIELFQQIIQHYGDNAIISTVWKDDEITGAGIVLFNGKQASIPWASTRSEFNRLAPNMLLYWSLLEYVNDHGCTQFDFGRSTSGEGTYKFKKQWGAQPAPLNWQTYTGSTLHEPTHNHKTPGAIQADREPANEPGQLRTLVENVWQKLPLGLTIAIGPRIRKYISL